MSSISHYPFVSLDEGRNSVAFYTRIQPKVLIIFVHGFNGVSIKTWSEFIPLMLNEKEFEYSDLLFYGYDSLKGQAFDQALELLKFIDNHHSPNTKKIIRGSLNEYDKIILVGHSLGAIVSRYALLTAISQKLPWVDKSEMILFAPAHNGAKIHRLIANDASSPSGVLSSVVSFFKPIIKI